METGFSVARSFWFEKLETFPGESAPPGAQLEVSMDGGATLADTMLACQVLVTADASAKRMQAQFRSSGPYEQRVQVFDGGTLVYNESFPGEPAVNFQHWPQRVRQQLVGGLPQQEVQFDLTTFVAVNGLLAGSGNRIVISPEGPAAAPIAAFSRHRIQVMQIDSLHMVPLLPATLVSTAGAGSFGGATDFTTGSGPRSLVLGDLNLDGNPDLAVANNNDNTVSVRLGNGSGGFGPNTVYPTGTQPRSVAIGDVTGDGIPDLLVADHADFQVSILPGNGLGGFGARSSYPIASSPSAVAIADLNGDGLQDVLVAGAGLTGIVSVLLADGAGGLGAETSYLTGDDPTALAVGEIDGDGLPDVVVANSASNTISLLLGDGLGALGSKTDFPAGASPSSVSLADVDNDGLPDLVVANPSGGTISLLPGFGPGSFVAGTTLAVGGSPNGVAVADLNGDENSDFAVSNASGGSTAVLFGDGLGGGSNRTNLIAGGQPNAVVCGDLNNDGLCDVLEVDGMGFVSVVLGLGGSISPPGPREIAALASPTYAIAPSSGYVIANVLADGVAQGPIGSYQFHNVNSPHTITARFTRVVAVGSSATPLALALRVEQANPTTGHSVRVQLTLPTASPAQLELLDIGGRRMLQREVGSLGAGQHRVSLLPVRPMKSGLYWIRLTQGTSKRTEKVVVIE